MDTQTLIRLIIGLLMTAIVLVFAAKRVLWLSHLGTAGQPVGEESGRTDHMGERIGTQVKEVFAQTRMLRWSIPGLAHFFTMWGFFILVTVYLEAYGVLFDPKFHIPFVGRWEVLGFLQDFFAVAVLLGITTFAIIRLRTEPKEHGRYSRFYGSHTGGAWLILFMIFNVILTYRLLPRRRGEHREPAIRQGCILLAWHGSLPHPLGHTANEWIETVALLAHIGVDAGVPAHRAALQAPAHRPGTDQRHVQAAAQRSGPAAAVESQGQADRLRGSRRGRRAGSWQDRGLHVEGLPRLHDLHRVRSVPVAVPGVEHRQAAVSQARDHEPARPHVRQGALHPGRQGDRRWRTPPRAASARTSAARSTTKNTTFRNRDSSESWARGPHRPPVRWSARSSRAVSSTPTCCGRAPPAVRASSSARWTSSTSTTSSICAATR